MLIKFTIDESTLHPGVKIEDGIATKETNGGWVTLKTTKSLSPSNCQWAVKIVDQGEGGDASGLMIGLLPKSALTGSTDSYGSRKDGSMGYGTKLASKYISEMGGWCMSRAGTRYGAWESKELTFGTGSQVNVQALDAAFHTHLAFSLFVLVMTNAHPFAEPAAIHASTVDLTLNTMTIMCGPDKVVGSIPNLCDQEVYPAFSLYYLNQKATFV
eukprot:gene1237-2703_t